MSENDQADPSTKRRVLEAAVGLFAEKGYTATSVRLVCEQAGANIAAVNYHFGSKQGLYDAAIDFARAESNDRNAWVDLDEHRDFWSSELPEERLTRFIAMMMDHALDPAGHASDLSRIMIHEMLSPTPAFDRQVKVSIGRVFDALCEICREIAGPEVDEDAIARVALLVSAQCLYQSLAAGVIPLMHPGVRFDVEGRTALATMVTSTTLAALRALREG